MNPDCKMVFLSKRLSSHLYFMGNKYICHRYIWCIESSFLTNPLYLLLHISHLCCSKSFSKHFRNFCQNGHKTGGLGWVNNYTCIFTFHVIIETKINEGANDNLLFTTSRKYSYLQKLIFYFLIFTTIKFAQNRHEFVSQLKFIKTLEKVEIE